MFSVIIPTFRRQVDLIENLRAIVDAARMGIDLEVIVSDDDIQGSALSARAQLTTEERSYFQLVYIKMLAILMDRLEQEIAASIWPKVNGSILSMMMIASIRLVF